jgi:ribosomal 50S subunit-associated protein YjgA (DUF615 family)
MKNRYIVPSFIIYTNFLQRLEQRHRLEAELRQRIEQLEKRQTQDDAVLNVVNRYWNQLNEDIRVLLQRFDAETADESENRSMFNFLKCNNLLYMFTCFNIRETVFCVQSVCMCFI